MLSCLILSDPPLPWWEGGGGASGSGSCLYIQQEKSHLDPLPHPATYCKKIIYKNIAHLNSQCEEKLPVGRSHYKSISEFKGSLATSLGRLLTLEVFRLTVEILSSVSSVCATQPASAVTFCQGEWKFWNQGTQRIPYSSCLILVYFCFFHLFSLHCFLLLSLNEHI